MLTPVFDVSQDGEFVNVSVRLPYVKVKQICHLCCVPDRLVGRFH